MKKGFVIAVDALLALVILFTLVTLSFDILKQDGSDWSQRRTLNGVAHYSGEVLESSTILSRAVIADNTTEIRGFLDALPFNICASTRVFPAANTSDTTFLVSKSGCSGTASLSEVVRRSFIVTSPPDANVYVAQITTWLNEGS